MPGKVQNVDPILATYISLRDTGLAVRPIDFADLRSKDTLNSNPPKMFNQIFAAPQLFAPLIRTASEGTGP